MEELKHEKLVADTMGKIRQQMFDRGIQGLGSMRRAFRLADTNGNRKLDIEEFEEALGYAQLFLSKYDLRAAFKEFDVTGEGCIDYDEFVRGVKGDTLNPRRKAMVDKCFGVMDRDGSGVLTLADVKGIYNASKHPLVLEGKKTEDAVLADFLSSFEGAGSESKGDGSVSKAEFLDYYNDISASIPSDDYFVEMLERCWMITEGPVDAATLAKLAAYEEILREKVRQKSTPSESGSQKLRSIFKFFDYDESGAITIDEFRKAMERLCIPLELRDARGFFSIFDADGSGRIEYEEFVKHVYNDE